MVKKEERKTKISLTWFPKKTFELRLTIPWQEIKKTYEKVLKEIAKTVEIKGFRKGKAPLPLVKKKVSKQSVYEEIIKKILPQKYAEAIKELKLRPVCAPKFKLEKVQEKDDWQITAKACEFPDVKLGNYEEEVKGSLASEKIWTPDKGNLDKPAEKKASPTNKLNKVLETLLNNCQVEVSEVLIAEETNRMLSKLLEEIKRLGLTLEEYLANNNKNADLLKKEYQQLAERTLKLEFILQAIAEAKNIKVQEKEIKQMIAAVPEKETREKLNTPEQNLYISSILRKRKVLDYLTNL